ncbi:MAG TPA: FAD-dependent oxidoreductase [Abditibacteriaceae bacterium]|nr:FAD-dependent oxidoreductase [Abditibacteriaceae bacterium]
MKRIAIIGGGPIGVEAALYGACAGFDVRLYERGRLAENVRAWGYINVFTEWKRNRSPLACRLLGAQGVLLPDGETTSTGDELAAYVGQLAALSPLRGRIQAHTEVVSVTRERCLKSDFINDPRRAAFPFRLHLRDASGDRIEHAAVVLDATGVYATPNWMGSGGAPCPGEREWRARIDYHLPDVAGRDRARFADRHTLIVGSGHSAASTLRSICDLIPDHPRTRVTWIVRRDVPPHGYPYTLVPDDPSPHRDDLHRRANELTEHPSVDFRPRTVVDSITHDGRVFRVLVSTYGSGESSRQAQSSWLHCDNIAAHTGFGPDPALWSDLQVHTHPATGGPYRLAEALIAINFHAGVGLSTGYAEKKPREAGEAEAGSTLQDRFQVVLNDPEFLRHPEPNFFVIGIKSYGRDAGFLMQNGFRQVRDVFKLISGDAALDLYEGALD